MVPDKSEEHIATADEMVEATMGTSKVNASTITAQKADLPTVGGIDEKRPSIEMAMSDADSGGGGMERGLLQLSSTTARFEEIDHRQQSSATPSTSTSTTQNTTTPTTTSTVEKHQQNTNTTAPALIPSATTNTIPFILCNS